MVMVRLAGEKDKLSSELSSKSTLLNTAQTELSEATSTLFSLQDELVTLRSAATDHDTALKEVQSSHTSISERLAIADTARAMTKEELTTMTREKERLEGELASWAQQAEQSRQEGKTELKARIASVSSEMEGLKGQLEEEKSGRLAEQQAWQTEKEVSG